MISEAPQNPAGAYISEVELSPQRRDELITVIETTPPALRNAVENLTEGQLATKYRNWTIRQIVHHLADSHVNSYVRFKWTLTEDFPTIKAYDEGRWAALDDSLQNQTPEAPPHENNIIQVIRLQAVHNAAGHLFEGDVFRRLKHVMASQSW